MAKRKETLEMARLYGDEGWTMERIAAEYGISRQAVSKRFARMKIPARPIKLPDENSLRALYSDEKKTLRKIAEELKTNVYSVNKALKLYKIPKRGGFKRGGARVDLIRSLKPGESLCFKTDIKNPHSRFHNTAKMCGLKISLRKIRGNEFELTRIK